MFRISASRRRLTIPATGVAGLVQLLQHWQQEERRQQEEAALKERCTELLDAERKVETIKASKRAADRLVQEPKKKPGPKSKSSTRPSSGPDVMEAGKKRKKSSEDTTTNARSSPPYSPNQAPARTGGLRERLLPGPFS
ncbi:hypothetical protein CYMTET_21715 [Cymbomonas tetramitiformis]|uniref:Uncharacterized protein n=1 Tax=Cymbomonas tetramitiformis TaxID=36881 RepID=A0AAE0G1V1_9CHLO|nr:hypothetical protein CYMTET_21715 [Cymbomonas tetramitiformis]